MMTVNESTPSPRKKFQFRMPTGILIVVFIAIFACLLTYIVPAGEFGKITDAAGNETITFESFKYIKQTPISLLRLPMLFIQGAIGVTDVLLIYFASGGAMMIVFKSGAINAVIDSMIRRFGEKRRLILVVFTLIFALFCLMLMPQSFVAFVPVLVILAARLGYDPLTGISMIMFGSAVSYSTGPFGTSTALAQSIVGLPLLSGWTYRLFSMVLILIPTIIYEVRYAERVRKDPSKSYVPRLAAKVEEREEHVPETPLTLPRVLILLCLLATLVAMVTGTVLWKWSLNEYAAAYLVLAVVAGLISRCGLNKITTRFVEGAQSLLGAAVITAIAYSVTIILTQGHILDTVIYALTCVMLKLPPFMCAPAMFIMQILINFIVVSGGGQAMITMPIMSSVSTLVGVPMQSAVLAFNFGDGFCNYILPHSAQCISFVEAARIPFPCYLKYVWKIFLVWVIMCCVLMYGSTLLWG